MSDATPDIRWEVLFYFYTISWAALGDRDLVDDQTCNWNEYPDTPSVIVDQSGVGMLFGRIENDGVPIEVGYRGKQVVRARLEAVSDVEELETAGDSRWVEVGQVLIGPSGAVVWTDILEHEIPLPQGIYRAESFPTSDDDLGIRLILM